MSICLRVECWVIISDNHFEQVPAYSVSLYFHNRDDTPIGYFH